MQTELLTVDPLAIEAPAIERAARIIRAGGLVAFPTETVYGLGANALDAAAVLRIFEAKGRPPTNPLIVHITCAAEAQKLAAEWPRSAQLLSERFWPGPLTLVLPRAGSIPDAVAAGGPTVGLRAPAHPVARALLWAAAVPIAAPSANRSLQVSPTCAAHVLKGLDGRIDLALDGGPAAGGLESTVLDLTVTPPRILRPGLITVRAIEAVIGTVTSGGETDCPARSPGQMRRHYAPRAGLENVAMGGLARAISISSVGLKIAWMARASDVAEANATGARFPPAMMVLSMPEDAAGYASRLYAALHEIDEAGADRIVVSGVPDEPEWTAIRDRLTRAAAVE